MSEALCQEFEDKLGDLVDESRMLSEKAASGKSAGDASPDHRQLLEHAQSCSRCRESLDSYRKTVALLRRLPDTVLPGDFLSWVREAMDAERRERTTGARRLWRNPWWLGVAASLVLATGLGGFLVLSGYLSNRQDAEIAMQFAEDTQATPEDVARPQEKGLKELDATAKRFQTWQIVADTGAVPAASRVVRIDVSPAQLATLESLDPQALGKYEAAGFERHRKGDGVLIAFQMPEDRLGDLRKKLETLGKAKIEGALEKKSLAAKERRGSRGALTRSASRVQAEVHEDSLSRKELEKSAHEAADAEDEAAEAAKAADDVEEKKSLGVLASSKSDVSSEQAIRQAGRETDLAQRAKSPSPARAARIWIRVEIRLQSETSPASR